MWTHHKKVRIHKHPCASSWTSLFWRTNMISGNQALSSQMYKCPDDTLLFLLDPFFPWIWGPSVRKGNSKNQAHIKLQDTMDQKQKSENKISTSIALSAWLSFTIRCLSLFLCSSVGTLTLQSFHATFLTTHNRISSPKSFFYPLQIPISLPFPFFQLCFTLLQQCQLVLELYNVNFGVEERLQGLPISKHPGCPPLFIIPTPPPSG